MKRYLFFICSFACVLFCACGTNILKEVKLNVAEVRNNFFISDCEYAKINFTSGTREEPYILNGICEQNVEFGVLTVKFLVITKEFNTEPCYILTVNGCDYDGTLVQNPFDLTYVTDINTLVLDDASISVKITFDSLIIEDDLICISKDWKIKADNVLEIAVKEFEDKISNLKNANGLNAEYYVKIIYDPDFKLDQYYWYFSAFTKSGEIFSAVIDVSSGEILTK